MRIIVQVTSSEVLFTGSCGLAAPLAVELPFSSLTLPTGKTIFKFYRGLIFFIYLMKNNLNYTVEKQTSIGIPVSIT